MLALGCAISFSASSIFTSCQKQNHPLGCYALLTEEDTLRLSLFTLYPSVSGTMIYDGGSDHYTGTVNGTMHGDTLLGKYTAGVEGSALTTPIAFLRRSDGYARGGCELVMREGKFEFERVSALKFGRGVLKPVPCSK
jgi:hypothetical protein